MDFKQQRHWDKAQLPRQRAVRRQSAGARLLVSSLLLFWLTVVINLPQWKQWKQSNQLNQLKQLKQLELLPQMKERFTYLKSCTVTLTVVSRNTRTGGGEEII